MSRTSFKQKWSLHTLFSNNKFLFVFSVVAAFVIWSVITVTQAPETESEIGNVSVTIDMSESSQPSQLGLQYFGQTDTRVNVRVRGKRYEVNALNAGDIVVTADTSGVGAAGMHTLRLSASCSNNDVEVVSVSPSSIDVYFDAYKEQQFTLEPDISAPNGVVPDGYTYNAALSSQSIVISGPATEVNRVQRVVASVDVDTPLTASPSEPLTATVTALTASGDEPRYVAIKGNETVTVSIQVLKIRQLPVSVSFTGAPSAYATAPLPYTVSPATVQVAGAPDTIDSLDALVVGTVDFSKLGELGGTFYFRAADISGFKVMDDVDTFTVQVTPSDMGSAVFSLPSSSIALRNIPEGFSARIEEAELTDVTIVGARSEIANLTSADLTVQADLSGLTAAGRYTVNVSVAVPGRSTCWAYATYAVTVNLTAVD